MGVLRLGAPGAGGKTLWLDEMATATATTFRPGYTEYRIADPALGWKATVDDKSVDIQRVNYILRGVYLTPGTHKVEFRFDPLPFKIGKYLTLASFALFAGMLIREWRLRRKMVPCEG